MSKKTNKIPDILNSRNERVIFELPNYSFCHSSQSEDRARPFFIGRKNLIERLKTLMTASSSKTGVYLITGGRGVGKSSLVEEVIEKTSLSKHTHLKYFNFLFVALFFVFGIAVITNQNWVPEWINSYVFLGILIGIVIIVFSIIGHFSYLRKEATQYDDYKSGLKRTIIAAARDFLLLPNKPNSFLKTRNVLKIIVILLLCQFFSILTTFTQLQVFIVYLCAITGYHYNRYARQSFIDEYRKAFENKKKEWLYKNKNTTLADAFNKESIEQDSIISVILLSLAFPVLLFKHYQYWIWILNFGVFLIIFVIFVKNFLIIKKTLNENTDCFKAVTIWLKYSIPHITKPLNELSDYIKNSSRIYLRINFGHDVLKERDVLRLITRTLTTEYNNFCKSWQHTLSWRVLALAILLSATYLFYKNIYRHDILPLVEAQNYNKSNSQEYYSSSYDDKRSSDSTFLKIYLDNTKKPIPYYNKPLVLTQADKAINRIWCYVLNAPDYFFGHC